MMILVINAGSSSLKYQLFDMDHEKVLCKGNCERIGLDKSVIGHKTNDGKKIEKEVAMQNHKDAFMQVNAMLTDAEYEDNLGKETFFREYLYVIRGDINE